MAETPAELIDQVQCARGLVLREFTTESMDLFHARLNMEDTLALADGLANCAKVLGFTINLPLLSNVDAAEPLVCYLRDSSVDLRKIGIHSIFWLDRDMAEQVQLGQGGGLNVQDEAVVAELLVDALCDNTRLQSVEDLSLKFYERLPPSVARLLHRFSAILETLDHWLSTSAASGSF